MPRRNKRDCPWTLWHASEQLPQRTQRSISITRRLAPSTMPVEISCSDALSERTSGTDSIVGGKALSALEKPEKAVTSKSRRLGSAVSVVNGSSRTSVRAIRLALYFHLSRRISPSIPKQFPAPRKSTPIVEPLPPTIPELTAAMGMPRERLTQPLLIRMTLSIGLPS